MLYPLYPAPSSARRARWDELGVRPVTPGEQFADRVRFLDGAAVAVWNGYYESPRKTTHRAIATELESLRGDR